MNPGGSYYGTLLAPTILVTTRKEVIFHDMS